MGPALCLLSAACFGAMPIFGKLAYGTGVPPGALLLLRFTAAAGLLATVLLLQRGPRAGRAAAVRVTPGLVLIAVGLGAVGYALQAALYFAALERVDAPTVSLILYTYPALVTLAAATLGRERLTPRRVSALAVASFGTLLVLVGGGGVTLDLVGVGLAFGSAVVYTGYILVADTVVHRMPPVTLAALVMTGAALALAAHTLATGGVDLGLGPAGWFWIACIAVVSTVAAMLAFFAGLRRVGPSAAAILSTFEPVVTVALAGLVLREFVTPAQLVGGFVVLSSAAVLQITPKPARATDQARAGAGRGREGPPARSRLLSSR